MILDKDGQPFPVQFEECKPSDANYLANMTKQELVEYAQCKMMPVRMVLESARRARKRLARGTP